MIGHPTFLVRIRKGNHRDPGNAYLIPKREQWDCRGGWYFAVDPQRLWEKYTLLPQLYCFPMKCITGLLSPLLFFIFVCAFNRDFLKGKQLKILVGVLDKNTQNIKNVGSIEGAESLRGVQTGFRSLYESLRAMPISFWSSPWMGLFSLVSAWKGWLNS